MLIVVLCVASSSKRESGPARDEADGDALPIDESVDAHSRLRFVTPLVTTTQSALRHGLVGAAGLGEALRQTTEELRRSDRGDS